MTLTNNDKEQLKAWGYTEKDFWQIEKTMNCCKFKLSDRKSGMSKDVSAKKALDVLGSKEFLSGISRAAFHCSAGRMSEDESMYVDFDNYKMFNL